jgi:hypothetical protein
MDIRPIFSQEIGFTISWEKDAVDHGQVLGFEKEEPKPRVFLPKVGLMSIFAELHLIMKEICS